MAEGWGRFAKKHYAKTREQQVSACRELGFGRIAAEEGELCTIRQRAA
jgi:hypothetical protein